MLLGDRLQNLLSGLGGASDKGAANAFVQIILGKAELDAMYRSDWLARKIVDIPAGDAVRAWRDWQAEDDQIEALEEEERRLGVRQKVARAMRLARLYGGSAIVIGLGDGNPSQPAMIESVRRWSERGGGIRYLHVVTCHELQSGEINRDPETEGFGQPLYYTVSGADRAQVRIHPSRVVRFVGAELPDWTLSPNGWGDPVLQAVYEAVRQAASAAEHVAALIPEAKTDVIRVPGLSGALATAETTSRLTTRFRYAAQMKSMIHMLLLEGGAEEASEQWEQKQVSFGEFPDLIRTYLQIAAGAADIPVTRLLGQSPLGLNATGESDIRNYYDRISADQEITLRPALSVLDEALIRSALGSRPEEIHYRWAPLWQLSENERSEIAKRKAETTQIYINSGLVPSDALARAIVNQLVEDSVYPGLEAALAEASQTPEELALEEQEAAAELEAMGAELQAKQGQPGQEERREEQEAS